MAYSYGHGKALELRWKDFKTLELRWKDFKDLIRYGFNLLDLFGLSLYSLFKDYEALYMFCLRE